MSSQIKAQTVLAQLLRYFDNKLKQLAHFSYTLWQCSLKSVSNLRGCI
jgi:hypothetical protein